MSTFVNSNMHFGGKITVDKTTKHSIALKYGDSMLQEREREREREREKWVAVDQPVWENK